MELPPEDDTDEVDLVSEGGEYKRLRREEVELPLDDDTDEVDLVTEGGKYDGVLLNGTLNEGAGLTSSSVLGCSRPGFVVGGLVSTGASWLSISDIVVVDNLRFFVG